MTGQSLPAFRLSSVDYVRVYLAFVRNCLAREMEFRGHFFVLVFANGLWAVLSLAVTGFVFSNVRSVAGWDLDRMILFTGTFLLVTALVNFLFKDNMASLSELVNQGNLDYVLVKPMPSQFLVSMRYVKFSELPATVVATAYVLEGARRTGLQPGPLDMLIYLALIIAAVSSYYAVWFMSVTMALWTGRINNIAFLAMPVMDLGRVPTDVYAGAIQAFFTFVLPIAIVATIPSKALLGILQPESALYPLIVAPVLLVVSNRFWTYSLRKYSSASS